MQFKEKKRESWRLKHCLANDNLGVRREPCAKGVKQENKDHCRDLTSFFELDDGMMQAAEDLIHKQQIKLPSCRGC